MTECINADCSHVAKQLGSAPYIRADYCTSCYYAWFGTVTLQEDVASGKLGPAVHGTPIPAADALATPVWRRGRNVVVRQKVCNSCGALIHIRKNPKGKHYPADMGSPRPHRCPA